MMGARSRPRTIVEGLGRLVLLDSGASVEMCTFPEAWMGQPPQGALLTSIQMAAGEVEAMLNAIRAAKDAQDAKDAEDADA